MAAVFSSALKSNASKVPTRFSNPPNQTNYLTNPTSTPVKPTKFKRSIVETGMDSPATKRAPADGFEPFAEDARAISPKNGKVCSFSESRKRYLGEKAAAIEMPTDEAAEIHPRFLFDDPVLIIHMCLDCRMASRLLEMKDVDGENQHLAVNLCKVCRSTFRSQRRVKFFQHDLPCFKRQHDIKKI